MEREPATNGLKWSLRLTIIIVIVLIGVFLFIGLTRIFRNILITGLIILIISWIKSVFAYLKSIKKS